MQISVLRGNICVGGMGGLFLWKCLTSDQICTKSDILVRLNRTDFFLKDSRGAHTLETVLFNIVGISI